MKRVLTILTFLTLTACGTVPDISTITAEAPQVPSLATSSTHVYRLVVTGDALKLAATIITDAGQVIAPSGGGTATIPSGGSVELEYQGTTASVQVTRVSSIPGTMTATAYIDGVAQSIQYPTIASPDINWSL